MNSKGACVPQKHHKPGGKTSRANRNRRMPMGGPVRGNPNSRRVIGAVRDNMRRFNDSNPGLIEQVNYLSSTKSNLEAYLRGQGPQWEGGSATYARGGQVKMNQMPQPELHCQVMCGTYNNYGNGCHSGMYDGIVSCDCSCCFSHTTYTGGAGGGGYGDNNWDNHQTVCNCSYCNYQYNMCMDQCILNQMGSGYGHRGAGENPDGDKRRGGRIKRSRRKR